MQLWRLTRNTHAATCLDGIGASIAGGRWNPRGDRAVYTAGTRALAILEMLVNADSDLLPRDYMFIEINLPDTMQILRVEDLVSLPASWRDSPVQDATQSIGRKWLRSMNSAVLSVPSAVVPEERNYIINPNHPMAKDIVPGTIAPVDFDRRLFR